MITIGFLYATKEDETRIDRKGGTIAGNQESK